VSLDPLEDLLRKLGSGNTAEAEQAFRAYEPFLRMVVRRRLPADLRSKFDSVDVVQTVWADVLVGFRKNRWRFADAAHLRAFLVRLTRHRFIDRLRHYRRTVEREQPLVADVLQSTDPRPSQIAQAAELWEQMLALCPPAHREVLHLKRQGAPLAEIAQRTGLHEGSVRRILYDLARRLARQQQEGK
jgi:RNA polymerase sigma-70 factor (ECF subfamily)